MSIQLRCPEAPGVSVCLVAAEMASCPLAGCRCKGRTACYPSDMTDPEWEVLEPEAKALMAELRRGPGGRPMSHDPRAMIDAIGYVTKYGVQWRALPVGFPPWEAVYTFFERRRELPTPVFDRLPVGQGSRHRRGQEQGFRRGEDQRAEVAHRGRCRRAAGGRGGHRGIGAGP